LNSEADTLREANRTVYFATTNRGKYAEAAILAANFGVSLKQLNVKKPEIQDDKLENIASFAASHLAEIRHCRVVCEDAGFFVHALNEFPGPYSAQVYRQIGVAGVLKLMRGIVNRKAQFKAAVAYATPGKLVKCFTGTVDGTVSVRPRGKHGFGFDPIFIPYAGEDRTFAEMTVEEKNSFSHRAHAFAKFCKWLNSTRRSRLP
jgi:XTP/dITP diphosphohydrolase